MSNLKLIPLYKAMLAAAGLSVTDDGFVRLEVNGEVYPATHKKQQLVLPIREQLTSLHINDRLVFNPLSENGLINEGELQAFFRQLLVVRVNTVAATLMLELITLAASPARHRDLSSDQRAYLEVLPDADERMLKDMTALIKQMPAKQTERAITHIHMRKAGLYKGRSYKRVAAVSFPLYNEFQKWNKEELDKKADRESGHAPAKAAKKAAGSRSGREIFDVEIRMKDREPFIRLLQYLFPQIDEAEAYNHGSNSAMAPGMDALMHVFKNLASRLNEVVDLFTGVIVDVEKLRFDDNWVPSFDNIDLLWPEVRDIPGQSQQVTPEAPAQQAAPAPAAAPAPVAYAVPPAAPAAPPWGAHPSAPVPGQWVNGQFVPMPPPPAYGAPAAQAPRPQGGGSSLASVLAANPVLAGAGMPPPGYPQQGNYPPPGYYPPAGGGYPPPGYYPPQQQQGYYPPQQQQASAPAPWHVPNRPRY